MKKIVFIIICLFSCISITYAQDRHEEHKKTKAIQKKRLAEIKKTMTTARSAIKSGKGLSDSEKALRSILDDTINVKDTRIHQLLFETIKKQYDQENEKLFLGQKTDTASLFMLAQRMFFSLNRLDSIDSMPGKDGKVEIKYRKSSSSELSPYYNNLYAGGIYFFNHKKYKESLSLLDTYLCSPKWNLFSQTELPKDSTKRKHASYITLVAGFLSKQYDEALRFADDALAYTSRHETALQYIAETYLAKSDTIKYIEYLNMGMNEYPKSMYFYPHLIDYYSSHSMYEQALNITDNVLKTDSTNHLCLRTRNTILLNIGKYDECISSGKILLEQNDSLPDINYNVALAYYNKAMKVQEIRNIKNREKQKKINQIYMQCRPYMEKYRALEPEKKELWKPVLYNIYLSLNLGKEFAEIESL